LAALLKNQGKKKKGRLKPKQKGGRHPLTCWKKGGGPPRGPVRGKGAAALSLTTKKKRRTDHFFYFIGKRKRGRVGIRGSKKKKGEGFPTTIGCTKNKKKKNPQNQRSPRPKAKNGSKEKKFSPGERKWKEKNRARGGKKEREITWSREKLTGIL